MMTLVLALTGCMLSAEYRANTKVASPKPVRMLAAEQHEEKNLSKEHKFPCNIRGTGSLTLLPGIYVKVAEDNEGVYWMNRIIRSGNLGIKDRGGIFIPSDKNKMPEAWMVPQNMTIMVGPGLMIPTSYHDAKTTVIYMGDIPADAANEILSDFK
jgi:hypothetical protein